jgi:hypothetical protein
LKARVANLAWTGEARELGQNAGQDRFIALPVVRLAECPADGMIDEDGARGRDFAHDVEDGAGDQGGDFPALYDVGDETDGLVTEGSIGDQQRQVYSGRLELARYRRRDLVLDFLMATKAAHEGDMERRKTADNASPGELGQCGSGKNDLGVLPWHPADAGVMIDHQLARRRVGGNQPVTPVFPGHEGRLGGEAQRRAGQQGHA